MKNKQGKADKLLVFVIIAIALVGVFYLFGTGVIKQEPAPIEFGDDDSEPGGLTLELIGEEGDRGYMAEEFYEIVSNGFAIVRGATAVACTTDTFCQARCPTGDTFCDSHITCYAEKCSYKQITGFAQHTEVANVGEAILNVFFDSATTSPASTAFNTAYAGKIGTSVVLEQGEKYDFVSADMSLSTYETGTATAFTVGAHAVNQYTGARIPITGSQTSSVTLTVYPDPATEGFTISLGELGGL